MTNIKQRAYVNSVNYQKDLRAHSLVAVCFLPELTGKQQRSLRTSLREHQMKLHYIKLNIFRTLLKAKNINGINNKLGLIYSNNSKNLLKVLTENKIMVSNLFFKNIVINLTFLAKKPKQFPNFSNLILYSDVIIKKPIIQILKIINLLNDNK